MNYTNLFAVSATVDLLVAVAFLFGYRPDSEAPPALDLRHAGVAALGTWGVFIVKMAAFSLVGLDFFGVIHLLYLDLVIVLPAAGALVLLTAFIPRRARPARKVSGVAVLLACLSLAMAPVGVYATFIEPFRLVLEECRVRMPSARTGAGAVRIGVLADIQTDRVTEHEIGAVDRLMRREPDLILLPGDLFQGSTAAFDRELPALRNLVGRLAAPGGVYAVLGNTDRRRHDVERVFRGSEVRLLVNEEVEVRVGDRRLTIAGVGVDDYRQTLRRLEQEPGDKDYRIVLAHYPDVALDLPANCRVDLVVAGHTHGGQVCLPLLGPPITLTRVPRRIAAGGLHRLDGRQIYVSRGVGWERLQAPRLRFLCPPEITLLTLE